MEKEEKEERSTNMKPKKGEPLTEKQIRSRISYALRRDKLLAYYRKSYTDPERREKLLEKKRRYMEKLRSDPERFKKYVERCKENNKNWYKRNKIQQRARNKKRYNDPVERAVLLKRQKAFYRNNKEKIKARKKKYLLAHRERINKQKRLHYHTVVKVRNQVKKALENIDSK